MDTKIRGVDSYHEEHRTLKEYQHGDISSNVIAKFSTWNFAINGMVTFLTFIIAVCRIMTIVVIITLNRFTLNLIFTSLVSPRDHDPTAVSWNKYVNIDEREKFMWKTHNIQFIFIRSGPYTSKNNRDSVECILRITVGNS